MQVGRIKELPGSKVIEHGKSQGYFGLPVRHSLIDDNVAGPNTHVMETAWFPTLGDIQKALDGAPVIVRILGFPAPGTDYVLPAPMNVYMGDVSEKNDG